MTQHTETWNYRDCERCIGIIVQEEELRKVMETFHLMTFLKTGV